MQGEKNKIVAGILAICLGTLGIQKFYLGFTKAGIILLLCGTVGWITFGLLPMAVGVYGLVEGIIYLTKTDEKFAADIAAGKEWM